MILKSELEDYSTVVLSLLRAKMSHVLEEEGTVAAENLRVSIVNEFGGMALKLGTTILAEKPPPDRVIRLATVQSTNTATVRGSAG